jgi:hypothetical protein
MTKEITEDITIPQKERKCRRKRMLDIEKDDYTTPTERRQKKVFGL